jgi:glycosyltransferase involved in cell wall biosynthesis
VILEWTNAVSYKDKSIAVVVPCFNEETQIGKVVSTMPAYVDHIIIIDDRSTDKTVDIVQQLSEDEKRIILIEHEENQGVGGAIASGYKWARDNGSDMAVVMAGDAQMDPDDMPALLDPVVEDGVNYAKGNRLIYPRARDLIPPVRYFGNSVLSLMTKVASGYWHVSDSQTGYTVIDSTALKQIDWDKMYKRYGQPNDVLVSLNIEQMRVRDVPIRPVYGVGEQSGIRVSKVINKISGVLLRGFLRRMHEKYIIRDFHPLVLFYSLGAVQAVLGLIFLLRILWIFVTGGEAPIASLIICMFMFSMSMQAVLFAMLFDMQSNRDLR